MEKYSVKINNNTYELLCETWETYRAWGHRVILLRNGVELNERKIRYYNRTWECYRYQTCMFGCIEDYIERECNKYIYAYRQATEITRFKKGEKRKLINTFNKSILVKELNALRECVRMRNFQDLKVS